MTKRYILKKDLPWIKAGEIFTIDDTKVRREDWYSSTLYVNSYWLFDAKEWFEEIIEKESIYDLKEWDEYYFISARWIIWEDDWHNDDTDNKLLSVWNIFLKREEAEKELSKMEARASIKKWIVLNDNDYKFIKNNNNYYIYYDFNYWILQYMYNNMDIDLNIHFSSEEIVEKAIIELENEFKTLFEI